MKFKDLRYFWQKHGCLIEQEKAKARDSKFKILDDFKGAKQVVVTFDNGYGASILCGSCFYSNGVDTYELAVLGQDGHVSYGTDLTDDVLGHLSEQAVEDALEKIEALPEPSPK